MRKSLPDLVSVSDLAKSLPQFSEATLRDLIYHSEPRVSAKGETIPPNGFGQCVIRLHSDVTKRGKVLIDRRAFLAWIEGKRVEPLASEQAAA